jgi:hypothetical protein
MTPRNREEPVYSGAYAATKKETVYLPNPDGHLKKAEVYVVVNALTDGIVAASARDGTINTIEGTTLAVAFAYHDPTERKFALVVPAARAHEELVLRAEWLRKLSDDRAAIVPVYVRELTAVVGPDALREWLANTAARGASAARDKENAAKEAQLEQREAVLANREERLRDRAEDVTRREDDLRMRNEELDVLRHELTVRQAQVARLFEQLDERTAAVEEREAEIADAAQVLEAERRSIPPPEPTRISSVPTSMSPSTQGSASKSEPPAARQSRPSAAPRVPSLVGFVAPTESVSEPSADRQSIPIELKARKSVPDEIVESIEPLTSSVELAPEPEPVEDPGPALSESINDDEQDSDDAPTLEPMLDAPEVESLGAEDEVDELDPLESETSPEKPEENDRAEVAWLAKHRDARIAVVDGEVRLWLRGTGDVVQQLVQREAVPLLQVDPDSVMPLALLSVTSGDGVTAFGRVVLDLTTAEDRAVIDTLKRDFHVRVEIVSRDGRALGGHSVSVQGETHAQTVAQVLEARAAGDELGRRVEMDRLAKDGITWAMQAQDSSQAERALFDETAIGSAEGTEQALRLIRWLAEPTAREHWILARGIPGTRVESAEKRVLFAMLRAGVTPDSALIARAVAMGVAPDERQLASRSLAAFARVCDGGPGTMGLDNAGAYRRMTELLAWAQRAGVDPIQPAVYDSLRKLYDPETVDGAECVDPRPIPSEAEWVVMDANALAQWCTHAKARAEASVRLARKSPIEHSSVLARSIKSLDAASAAKVVAALMPQANELGELWIELAASRRPVAVAAGLVAIAKTKLRRGLVPMLQRALGATESQLFGWAAGEFGAGAVRSLTSSMAEGEALERAAWVLAHAVRAGGGREVERVRTAKDGALSEAATRAVGAVDDARDYDTLLRSAKGITPAERAAGAILAAIEA